MTLGDLLGLIFSYVFAFSLLLCVEAIRRWRNYPSDFTRKIIHIGAGMWIWVILLLFDHWYLAIIPTGTFIVLNAIFQRYHLFSAMDPEASATVPVQGVLDSEASATTPKEDAVDSKVSTTNPKVGARYGTVYFAFSCTLLLAIFHQNWENGFPRGYEYFAMAGIMAMTWGDAFSAIIGRRFGKHPYIVAGAKRTLEGSLAGFVITFAAVAITLYILSPLTLSLVLIAALIAAAAQVVLEAFSPGGGDNLSVPIGIAIILYFLGL